MQKVEVEFQDRWLQIGRLTEEKFEGFSIVTKPSRPYELPRKLAAITFEMNLDTKLLERDTYDYMDWVGDIGGVYSALYIMGGFFISCLQY